MKRTASTDLPDDAWPDLGAGARGLPAAVRRVLGSTAIVAVIGWLAAGRAAEPQTAEPQAAVPGRPAAAATEAAGAHDSTTGGAPGTATATTPETGGAAAAEGVGGDEGVLGGWGVPYGTVLKSTGAPYYNNLRAMTIPFRAEPKVGGVEGRAWAPLPLPRLRANFPALRKGFEPKSADFKLGPVFGNLNSLSAGLLFSDNANLSEDNPKAGVIGVIRTGAMLHVQLTEGFQFTLAGAFTILPFEGTAGVSGFGLTAPFSASVTESGPLAYGQLVYDVKLGEWTVVVADDFHANYGGFHEGYADGLSLFQGFDYWDVDRLGRYSFSPLRKPMDDREFADREYHRENLDVVYFSNVVSAQAERLFPGSIRLRARASHENLWYNRDDRGLPAWREAAGVNLSSERENLRFKPWADYRATRIDGRDGINNAVRLGLRGPITDQLYVYMHAGYHLGASGRSTVLGGIRFEHDAGPYTRQTFGYLREVDEFEDEIHDYAYYTLSQTLGHRFTGQLAAHYGVREDIDNGTRYETWRVGPRLWCVLNPDIRLGAGAYLAGSEMGDWIGMGGRIEYEQFFSRNLSGRLSYAFNLRDSGREGRSYRENVLYMGMTQYFQ